MNQNKLNSEKSLFKIRILILEFENEISGFEIPAFRGAISKIAGFKNILFHNHEGDKFRYSYPLIQYKIHKKKPLILCIAEGVNDAHHFFENIQEGLFLGKRPYELKIEKLSLDKADLKVGDIEYSYRLNNWLPLNQENYSKYLSLKSEIDKITFLEKILIGNIISLAKGLGWNIESEIKIRINELGSLKIISVKSAKRAAFDIKFIANVLLPDLIGLGKNTSIGFGVLHKSNRL